MILIYLFTESRIFETVLFSCLIRLTLVQYHNIKLAYLTNMSEEHISPHPKFDKKSSLKKSNKPDQSKSKKKPVEWSDEPKIFNDNHNVQTTVEEKPIEFKSSKREALQNKGDSTFKEHLKQAERNEKSAKIMKSTDRASTIKENHNHIESNQRQFSLSKDNEQALQVSKKKMATESKRSKIQESDTKHPKTEEKVVSRIDQFVRQEPIKDQREAHKTDEHIHAEAEKTSNNEACQAEIKTSIQENGEKGDDKDNQIAKKVVKNSKPGTISKKRAEVSKSTKELEDHSKDAKRSKSLKKGSKSAAKSKDSKMIQGKSGVKKMKQEEKLK